MWWSPCSHGQDEFLAQFSLAPRGSHPPVVTVTGMSAHRLAGVIPSLCGNTWSPREPGSPWRSAHSLSRSSAASSGRCLARSGRHRNTWQEVGGAWMDGQMDRWRRRHARRLWKGMGTPVVCQMLFPGLPHCYLRKLSPGENKVFVAKQGLNFGSPVSPCWAWVGCPNPSALLGGLRSPGEQHQGASFPTWCDFKRF